MSSQLANVSLVYTVEDVAEILHLEPLKSGRKIEYHGPNPWGEGATEDGFIVFAEGNALDRKGRKYSSREVAEMAKIDPMTYQPYRDWKHANGNGAYTPKGSVEAVIEETKAEPKKEEKPEKKYDRRTIEQRGIRQETIEHFHIEPLPNDPGIEYPTFDAYGISGCSRQKFYDPVDAGKKYAKNKKPFKYRWSPFDTDPKPTGYNLQAAAGEVEVWLVGGEVDVWMCHQSGIKAVSGFGETRHTDKLVGELVDLGVEKIHIALDNDDAGHKGAIAVADACTKHNIDFTIREIMGLIGSDICDYCERVNFDPERSHEAIVALPVAKKATIEKWRGNLTSEVEKKKEEKAKSKVDDAVYLCSLIREMEPFMSKDEDFYLSMRDNDGVKRLYPLRNSRLDSRLVKLFCDNTNKIPSQEVMNNVYRYLQGIAVENGDVREVWIRSAQHDGKIYIDLNRHDELIVEIDPNLEGDGWRVVPHADCNVYFRRPKGVQPMPIPLHGGKIDRLKTIINAKRKETWVLMLAWLAYALHPPLRPYPVLCITGEQGTAKSTACKLLRRIVDPNFTSLIGGSIRDERDLAIMAKNCFVLGFDNLSGLQKWQSDALCQIVTEGGFRTRKLHTDDEEMLFSARRPIVLNGIDTLIGRQDFRNRSLVSTLSVIQEENRIEEQEVWDSFEEMWPELLGWICTTMAAAMRNLPKVEMPQKPRMADFAKWVVAAEMGGVFPWQPGEFMSVYNENRREVQESSVEADPLANEILLWSQAEPFIEGSPSDLLKRLNNRAEHESKEQHAWPKGPQAFTNGLNRAAPDLRAVGVNVVTGIKVSGGKRMVKIVRLDGSNRM